MVAAWADVDAGSEVSTSDVVGVVAATLALVWMAVVVPAVVTSVVNWATLDDADIFWGREARRQRDERAWKSED